MARTVLVLGAGASHDFGFPLGRGLRDIVCRLTSTKTAALSSCGFSQGEIRDFGDALSRSGYASVDWFLERHPDLIPIGRAAIAAALIPFENPHRLFPPNAPDAHWYEDLFNTLWSEEDSSLVFGRNLTILTFNYDRSLEYYLRTVAEVRMARRSAGVVAFEVRGPHRLAVAQGPTIVHLHGHLGNLPGLENSRPYGPVESAENVRIAAASLQLLSDARPDSEEFKIARSAIEAADRILFLGFGFHPKSVERLGDFASPAMRTKTIAGTRQGLSQNQWSRVLSTVLHNNWSEIRADNSVYGFLREHSPVE